MGLVFYGYGLILIPFALFLSINWSQLVITGLFYLEWIVRLRRWYDTGVPHKLI